MVKLSGYNFIGQFGIVDFGLKNNLRLVAKLII